MYKLNDQVEGVQFHRPNQFRQFVSSHKKIFFYLIIFFFTNFNFYQNFLTAEGKSEYKNRDAIDFVNKALINPKSPVISGRFLLPRNFKRVDIKESSFGNYLRSLPLKPHGTQVMYYNKKVKYNNDIYIAVADFDTGNQDLLQCADALMLLRGEYFFRQKKYDRIHFNLLKDGKPRYYKDYADKNHTYINFRKYMDYIFTYANTRSLFNEMIKVDYKNMMIGDAFIQTGKPYGHAVIIADMAVHDTTGEKLFLLAQSYMPAQEIQVLVNSNDREISPWYSSEFNGALRTPEWVFYREDLRRFKEDL